MKVLITGAAGFTAGHLARVLEQEERDLDCYFTDIRGAQAGKWIVGDLTLMSQTQTLLDAVRPSRIYHLAGTFSNDYETDYRVNVLSTKNLFDGVLELGLTCRTLLIGSAAEYGMISPGENPVREEAPLNPVSIYGLTKAYQTLLMKSYVNLYGIDAVMARTFNLSGRGLSEKLFVGRLYQQIEAFKEGRIPRIEVGNLESRRDYISIEEAVRYYSLVMRHGSKGEIYNVGSGCSIMIRDLLAGILQESGLDRSCVREGDRKKVGSIDIPEIYADMSKTRTLETRSAPQEKAIS